MVYIKKINLKEKKMTNLYFPYFLSKYDNMIFCCCFLFFITSLRDKTNFIILFVWFCKIFS